MKNGQRLSIMNMLLSQKLTLERGIFLFGKLLFTLLICLFVFSLLPVMLFAEEASVGVYYFPGWKNIEGEWWNPPWEKIKPYPEREPLLGYYPEGETWVSEKHIEWMYNAGIKFVVYDWYWTKKNTVYLEHALQAYMRSRNKNLVRFSVLWGNHTPVPENLKQFELMVDYWIKHYFNQKQFLQLDGKPVVFVFAPERLRDNAAQFGKTTKELLDLARLAALKAGFKGIYFVACTQANEYWVKDHIPKSGYDALSAYNYHRGYSGKFQAGGEAVNYIELAKGYKQSWTWILENSPYPYFIPVTSGWSKKPWGSNTPHDECISEPETFKKHLLDAKAVISRYPEKTKSMVVICCWNEFGEGSYIEPTKKYSFKYLETIKEVFSD